MTSARAVLSFLLVGTGLSYSTAHVCVTFIDPSINVPYVYQNLLDCEGTAMKVLSYIEGKKADNTV